MDDQPADPAYLFVRSLTEHLAQQPALPGLDIADLRTALANGGRGYFGQAEASGPNRAIKAAEAAMADLRRNIREGITE